MVITYMANKVYMKKAEEKIHYKVTSLRLIR